VVLVGVLLRQIEESEVLVCRQIAVVALLVITRTHPLKVIVLVH
jgi:hypothetical protein